MSNRIDERNSGAEAGRPSGARKAAGRGAGAWGGISVALLLGARSVFPMVRSLGPAGRHAVLLLLAAAAPVMIGMEVRRRRAERRSVAERTERARARLVRRGRPDERG